MNNKEFITMLAERTGYDQRTTQRLVNRMVMAMGDAFEESDSVSVPNFGLFEPKKKLERIIVNPATGARMLVPPKLVLTFKPAQTWKEKLKKDQP